jgi:sugar phosphate isomerase/epimerase
VQQLNGRRKASKNLGLTRTRLSPARSPGPTSTRGRSARRAWSRRRSTSWPALDADPRRSSTRNGVDLCYEIHPGEDLHDGVTYEMFLERVNNHPRANLLYDPSHFVLQQLDYLDYIDIYHERIKMFHVKDAEFNPTGRQGVYGGYQSWVNRAGRFRSLGDGQVDFASIFSKLAQYDFEGWAVLEWECAIKHPEDGAREGAEFIATTSSA